MLNESRWVSTSSTGFEGKKERARIQARGVQGTRDLNDVLPDREGDVRRDGRFVYARPQRERSHAAREAGEHGVERQEAGDEPQENSHRGGQVRQGRADATPPA